MLSFEVNFVKKGETVETRNGFVTQTLVSQDKIKWYPYQEVLDQRYRALNHRARRKAKAAAAGSAG